MNGGEALNSKGYCAFTEIQGDQSQDFVHQPLKLHTAGPMQWLQIHQYHMVRYHKTNCFSMVHKAKYQRCSYVALFQSLLSVSTMQALKKGKF